MVNQTWIMLCCLGFFLVFFFSFMYGSCVIYTPWNLEASCLMLPHLVSKLLVILPTNCMCFIGSVCRIETTHRLLCFNNKFLTTWTLLVLVIFGPVFFNVDVNYSSVYLDNHSYSLKCIEKSKVTI